MARARRDRPKGVPYPRKSASKEKETKKRRSWVLSFVLWVGASSLFLSIAVLVNRGDREPAALEVTGQPSLKVDRDTIDFGDVRRGRWVKASFTLTNVGDEPVRFTREPYLKVVAGC